MALLLALASTRCFAQDAGAETIVRPQGVGDDVSGLRAQDIGRNVTGVFVNGPATDAGYSPSFVMRGFPGGLSLIDGVAHGFISPAIDLSSIERVEFYRGPSAMLFGNALGGYGGAANYISIKPTDETFWHGSGTMGGFGLYRTTFDFNTPINDDRSALLRVTAAAQSQGSFVNFVNNRGFDITPTLVWTLADGDKLSFRGNYNFSDYRFRDGLPASPVFLHVNHEFYPGDPENERDRFHQYDLTLKYERAFNANWNIMAVVDYFHAATTFGWSPGWGYDGFHSILYGGAARTLNLSTSFDAQAQLRGEFDTGSIHHSVAIGLEHWDYLNRHNDLVTRAPRGPLDIFWPIYPGPVNFWGAPPALGYDRAWSQSVYAQDLIDLTSQWRIMFGGRYDLLAGRGQVNDSFGALSGSPGIVNSRGVDPRFSPRAGVLYRPSSQTSIFAAYGESLLPNTGVHLIDGKTAPPEVDSQYEIGLKHEIPNYKATLEIGLFDITRNHVAVPDPANPNGFYSVVTGRQHSHGVEANVSAEILPHLRVTAAMTFLHALVTKDSNTPSQLGSDLLGAPRRVYNLSASYTFDEGALKGLELSMGAYYASRTQTTLPNTYGFTLPPIENISLSASYELNDHLKLQLNAGNLLNRPNWTSNGALFLGEPRTISATLNYKY
jgi:iron complex outermembrane receptor protein